MSILIFICIYLVAPDLMRPDRLLDYCWNSIDTLASSCTDTFLTDYLVGECQGVSACKAHIPII